MNRTHSLGHGSPRGLPQPNDFVTPAREQTQAWLISTIADIVGTEPGNIDIREQLEYYGLDSLQAVQISNDLETWLGKPLSPTLVWDYPTIEQLSEFLTSENS